MRYKFSDKELDETIKKLVILVDTRECKNKHITNFFDKKKITYKNQKLDYGDYSCYLPDGSFEGQKRDIFFTNDIAMERKACIDEIAMNLKDNKTNINEIKKEIIELLGEEYLKKVLKTDYNRLKYEFANMNRYRVQFFILMEDKDFDKNLRNKNYINQYDPKTLHARIKALEREFKTIIRPIDKEFMGSEIYHTLKYEVRCILKHRGFIEK